MGAAATDSSRNALALELPLRVLVVDDDDDSRETLQRMLGHLGCPAMAASSGAEAWAIHCADPAAIIFSDWHMPDGDGIELCKRVRARDAASYTYFVFMTGFSDRAHFLAGMRAGADDYLTKPVSIALLAARLRALVRRGAALASNIVERGALHYDLGTRIATVDGVPVPLTNREHQLVRCLLLAGGGCVTRQELLDTVWGTDAGVDGSNVDIYIRRVRAKLAPVEVENVRGLGYRIAVPR